MKKSYETQSFLYEPTIPEIEIPETSRHCLYAVSRSLQLIAINQICIGLFKITYP